MIYIFLNIYYETFWLSFHGFIILKYIFNEEIAFKAIFYFWLLYFENLPLYQLARSFKGNFSLQFYFIKGFMI